MKPITEDFLIPLADAIRLFVNTEDVDFVQSATRARIHAARLAKMAHDEECQRLADEWVGERIKKFNADVEEYRQSYGPPVSIIGQKNMKDQVVWKRGEMWKEMRDSCPSIFRDYISETPPTE